MKTLQELISEGVQSANKEWATIFNKVLDTYCGDNDEIFVKNDTVFVYHFEYNNFEKKDNIKEFLREIKNNYVALCYTSYYGDGLRLYVLTEIYNRLKESDSIEDLIALLYKLTE